MNKTTKDYFIMFNSLPFLIVTLSYEDFSYQQLMEKAIKRGKPLTKEEIEKYFNNEQYDLNKS